MGGQVSDSNPHGIQGSTVYISTAGPEVIGRMFSMTPQDILSQSPAPVTVTTTSPRTVAGGTAQLTLGREMTWVAGSGHMSPQKHRAVRGDVRRFENEELMHHC